MLASYILAVALLGAGTVEAAGTSCAADAGGLVLSVRGVLVDVNRHGAMLVQDVPVSGAESPSRGAKVTAGSSGPDLEVGPVWTLITPEGRRAVRLPQALKRSAQDASVLARTPRGVWVRTVEGLAWVDATTADVRFTRLGGTGSQEWVLSTEPELELILGRRVLRCAPDAGCRELPRWPASIGERVQVGEGWLIQGGEPRPGVYRLQVGGTPTELVSGDVERVCADGTDMGWAEVQTTAGRRIVAVSMTATDVHIYEPDELLSYALIRAERLPPPDVVVPILQRAVDAKWPSAEALAIRAQREATEAVRRATAGAAPTLSTLRGAALLWKLSRDPSVAVRRAAFEAVVSTCETGVDASCTGLLAAFAADVEPSIGWTARDLLIADAPEQALWEASKEYKLDVLSALSARVARREDASALRALELLANDSEPEVRLRAHTVLNLTEP